MKTALITGVNGQDGAYLTDLLLEKGYMVHGIKRRSSLINTARIDHLYKDLHEKDVRFKLHYGDLTDDPSLIRIIQQTQPDEIYNLGAMSHVKVSFENPEYTANPTKAKTKLGWQPKYDLGMLVKEMMAADVEFFKKEKILKDKGYTLKKHFE